MLVQQLIDGLTLGRIYALRALASPWSGLLSLTLITDVRAPHFGLERPLMQAVEKRLKGHKSMS